MSEEKRPVGRPSKYKKEYCQQLIDHMSTGHSYQSFAGVIGTAIDTLYQWERNYEEFSDAKKEGQARCMLVWERMGMQGMIEKNIDPALWIFNMKNRFKWTNRDPEKEVEKKPLPSSYNIVRYNKKKELDGPVQEQADSRSEDE